MLKALIVSPYLDHLGGGERYMLTVASVLETLGYQIHFAWDNLSQIQELSSLLGITLKQPFVVPELKSLYFGHNPIHTYQATRPFDVVVYLSDGSIPLLGGKKNILHMQVPFHGVGGRGLKNRLKLKTISSTIVNSNFTKSIIDQEYGINSTVLYPPVVPITPVAKTNTILSVGRFDPSLNAKKHDILIKAFRSLSPQLPGWKLVLAGGSSNEEWIAKLTKLAYGFPIEIITNVPYSNLCKLYSASQIYWHAAGFEVDEKKNPELTEHFGISTVEAISAGAVPLVVPYGGQREIVTDTNLHWTTTEELITKTLWLSSHPSIAPIDITRYSIDNFSVGLKNLL